MYDELYLLWNPREGWGVFDLSSCPDPGAFPSYMYRKYIVPHEKFGRVFEKLMDIKGRLYTEKIIPQEGKENEIFPELSSLLAE